MIEDEKIIEMFFGRSEQGIRELDIKYYGFSGEYYIKSQIFSKLLYHTSREIDCGIFRVFSPALDRQS